MLKSLLAAPLIASAVVVAAPSTCLAFDWQLLPDSHHQLYQTFALFPEDHTMLVWRNGARAWGAIAGTLPIFDFGPEDFKIQMVMIGSANASYRLSGQGFLLLTETIDARVAAEFEHAFTDTTRAAVGWTHYSGHVTDDVEDMSLFGPDLGNEQLYVRVIHDFTGLGRVGGTLKPIVSSDTGMKVFAADQFVEWYPFGVSEDVRHGTWYLALGCDEYGQQQVDLTFTAQAGVYFGSHTFAQHTGQLRLAAGFYTGDDPRLKYMEFLNAKATFGYAGFIFDI